MLEDAKGKAVEKAKELHATAQQAAAPSGAGRAAGDARQGGAAHPRRGRRRTWSSATRRRPRSGRARGAALLRQRVRAPSWAARGPAARALRRARMCSRTSRSALPARARHARPARPRRRRARAPRARAGAGAGPSRARRRGATDDGADRADVAAEAARGRARARGGEAAAAAAALRGLTIKEIQDVACARRRRGARPARIRRGPAQAHEKASGLAKENWEKEEARAKQQLGRQAKLQQLEKRSSRSPPRARAATARRPGAAHRRVSPPARAASLRWLYRFVFYTDGNVTSRGCTPSRHGRASAAPRRARAERRCSARLPSRPGGSRRKRPP